eukprot:2575153-Amphidinium_carterae.1
MFKAHQNNCLLDQQRQICVELNVRAVDTECAQQDMQSHLLSIIGRLFVVSNSKNVLQVRHGQHCCRSLCTRLRPDSTAIPLCQ